MSWQDADATGGKLRQKHSMEAGETLGPTGLEPGELALQAADGRLIYKDSAGAIQGFPGGDGINKIVALTQAEYDALTPDATTLYVITD
jgi:hypothetical protein